MPKSTRYMIVSYSSDSESEEKLNRISRKTKVNKSKLRRMMYSYFDKNSENLKDLIKGDYD